MEKIVEYISTKDAPVAIGPYNQAVIANGFVFISGQLGIDPQTGKLIDGSIEGQTKQALKNLFNIAKASNFQSFVKTTCLLADINDFKKFNEIYSEFFKDEKPARATFAVKDLPMGGKVEIEAIAVIKKE